MAQVESRSMLDWWRENIHTANDGQVRWQYDYHMKEWRERMPASPSFFYIVVPSDESSRQLMEEDRAYYTKLDQFFKDITDLFEAELKRRGKWAEMKEYLGFSSSD